MKEHLFDWKYWLLICIALVFQGELLFQYRFYVLQVQVSSTLLETIAHDLQV